MLQIRVIITGLVVLYNAAFPTGDDPLKDDSHLLLERQEIPAEENAFTYIQKMADAAPEIDYWDKIYEMNETGEWDQQLVDEVLEAYSESFALVDEILARDRVSFPEVTLNLETPYLNNCRTMALMAKFRALNLQRQGKQIEAFDTTLDMLRCGYLLHTGNGVLIDSLVGIAIEHFSLDAARKLLERTEADGEYLRKFAHALEEYRSPLECLLNPPRSEYALNKLIISNLDEYILDYGEEIDIWHWRSMNPYWVIQPRGYFYKPNRTINRLAAMYDLYIEAVTALPDRQKMRSDLSALQHEIYRCVSYSFNQPFSSNQGGNIIVRVLGPYWAMSLTDAMYLRQRSYITITQTLIAMKLYQRDIGELPETLDALVPDYLNAVPLDEYTLEPLKYSRERKIIWAVGRDFEDNDGDETRDVVEKINF